MDDFWASLSPKLKSALWVENRRLVLSSDDTPLFMVHASRYKTAPKFYLFEDVFAVAQGVSITEYHLDALWLEHILPTETYTINTMTSFRLLYPEGSIELHCKELGHKSKWVTSIADAIGMELGQPQFTSGRGDLNLDTKLDLLRARDYMEYTFHSHSLYRDGKYRGQWRDAQPHGKGELSQETTGMLYKGGFKKGRFHGEGEMLWFSEKDKRKKFIGEFKNGHMDGYGEMKYSDGHIYSGHWKNDQRSGFGRLEETSKKNSIYTGSWKEDKKNGYGVYDDKMKHERYLGMWSDGVKSGQGMFVTSTGCYGEATFSGGHIMPGNDGFIIDPNGRAFMGKMGPDLKLCGKGKLFLTNGSTIEGTFGGHWLKKIEIYKAILEDPVILEDRDSNIMKELQIAKLDNRIGNCTVLACSKWQPIFTECESSLGFTGDATNDNFSAWSRLTSDVLQRKKRLAFEPRRSNSLGTDYPRTVRVPVELIPLERARALTALEGSGSKIRLEYSLNQPGGLNKKLSLSNSALDSIPPSSSSSSLCHHQNLSCSSDILEISRPLNLEQAMASPINFLSVPASMASPYAPQADVQRPHSAPEDEVNMRMGESIQQSFDTKTEIQKYLNQAFSTPRHPLGTLMQRLEMVYNASYSGIGVNKYLLPHAIAETHSLIQRINGIVRILFPLLSEEDQNVSQTGLRKVEGYQDPDDYVSIETGYGLLHSLVFMRLFPTLITLYVLHHDDRDRQYQRGLDFLRDMNDERLAKFITFPEHLCRKVAGKNADGNILKVIDQASSSLRVIVSLFTPGEFLAHFREAFAQLSNVDQLTGDFLLPAIVFILVKANIPHLGAYLHFLTDFAHTEPADEYTLVTYEASYNFIRNHAPGSF